MKADNTNTFYLKDPSLPTIDTTFEYTPEMIKDLEKCKKDIVYFAEKYFHIVNLDRGRELIKLYKPQKRILKSMVKNNRIVLLSSRQMGKALALDTLIPTPTGLTTMGALKDNDKIYGVDGKIYNIIKAHDILHNRECYKVTFDSGEEIIADGEHSWLTQNRSEKRSKINKEGSVKTTKEILETLFTSKNTTEPNHRIKKAMGLSGITQQLPINPYILGVWLGDGHSSGSRISMGKQDVKEMSELLNQPYFTIKTDGHDNFNYSINGKNKKHDTDCFKKQLRNLNLLDNKHIPNVYFLADYQQRLELLKGLMDTDGWVEKNGQSFIALSNKTLINDVDKLIKSLGYKTHLTIRKAKKIQHNDSYKLNFNPDNIIFKLQRKKNRQKIPTKQSRTQYHYIKNIEKVESVPVRCITVDSPDNLYLCGKNYIPTHNTTLITIFALHYCIFNNDKSVLIVANKEKTAIEILGRIRTAYELLPNWLKAGVKDYSKTNVVLANNSRIYVSTTASTAGRSSSINCLLIDEAAHIDKFKEDEFIKSIMPVISSSSNTKIFMISTANGTSNHFYKIYSGAERGENGWTAERVDWQEIPGRDDKWKQKAIADLGSIDAFEQEYNNKFIETGETAIDKDIIAEFRHMIKKPEIFDSPEYKVWETPDPKGIYIIGADVSDGVGGAASCLQGLNITDLTNIKQAFTYWNKFVDTAHFALEINNIAKQWGKPYILLERNSMGGEVINFLQRQPYNYERLVGYDSGQLQYEKLGIYSSTNVKYEGVSNMRYWVNSIRAVNIYDIATVQELETFVKYPNGTWHKQPGEGILDDRVMALVWALFGLHSIIAESIFEITQYDDRGKPLKIRKSYYDDNDNYYGLNQYRKDWGDQDFVPAFISVKSSQDANPEMDDLAADGWKVF